MARLRRYLNVLNGWEQVVAAQEANTAEIPHMEAPLAKLRGLLEQARNLTKQQDALTAGKQDVSKQLRKTIREGQRLANLMRVGAQEHFGPESEKLVEFGVQPFRGRAKKAAAKPTENPPTETPDPQSPTPSPVTSK